MLRAYEAFLHKRGAVKSPYASFYLKWVSDCYAFHNEALSIPLSGEQKRRFLSHLAKRHEDWQVKQADTALRLYDYFLSRNKSATDGTPSAQGEQWRHLDEQTRKAGHPQIIQYCSIL